MLSVLIPTYNYNVVSLVSEIQKQCLECEIVFEIIVFDDGSTLFSNENQEINSLSNCHFEVLAKNIGRSAIRNLLAKKALQNWLLLLDCDTFPAQNNFIKNYLSTISLSEHRVVFGGIQYKKERPRNEKLLRWVYGTKREALSLKVRNEKPNSRALTSNLLIQKKIFVKNVFDESITKYGYEDLVFLSDLEKKGILVKHIDNTTYHLGLETSLQFLDKTKIALYNLKIITENSSVTLSESKILRAYIFLKLFYLASIISFLFKKTKSKIEYNLLSQNPSLLLFDFYKLGYYCSIKSL